MKQGSLRQAQITALVDGYNVIKQHKLWRLLDLSQARLALTGALKHARWPIPVCAIEVIFDTQRQQEQPRFISKNLRMRFVSPSADEYIQRTIRASMHPELLMVVSDDREILQTAKSHATLRRSSKWLIGRMRPEISNNSSITQQEWPHGWSKRQRDELNSSLLQLWGSELNI